MAEIYKIIGIIATLAALIIGFFYLIRQAINLIVRTVGDDIAVITLMLEYAYYRKQFKGWIKDKKRIKTDKS